MIRPASTLRNLLRGFVLLLSLAALFATTAQAADLDGCWKGCWRSDCNGHDGKLRGSFTQVDDNHYCAQFSGDYWRIFPFRYSVLLTVEPQGDTLTLSGSKDLGPLFGGTFSFDGSVTGDQFKATYTSCRDRGEFNMKRLPPCGCCAR